MQVIGRIRVVNATTADIAALNDALAELVKLFETAQYDIQIVPSPDLVRAPTPTTTTTTT